MRGGHHDQALPFSPPIRSQADGVAKKLREGPGAQVSIADGERGEFAVLRGGSGVLRRPGDDLRTAGRVEAAVSWRTHPGG